MRWGRNLVAAVACTLLAVGCLEPPADSAPPPVTPDAINLDGSASSLDDVERQARRVTLRVRNLGCDRLSLGSGFAIAPDMLVTNRHVVAGTDHLEVNTWDGRRLTVEVALAATSHDLALVRVHDAELPAVVEIADDDPQPGDEVVVASHPGGRELVVRRGRVLGHTEDLLFGSAGGAVAMSVPLEPGSSGGAVFNLEGRVVGVVYAMSGDGETSYAVPASALQDVRDEDLLSDVPPCPDS
jgi:S1-C subfamily serine protease